jgi:hypothetical protein
MKQILETIDSQDCSLLREDYNEECIANLPNGDDIKQIQDKISHNLRV